MKYLLIAFGFVCLTSCHDLHQKLYDTFHDKKDTTKDSDDYKNVQLMPDEVKDDSGFIGRASETWEDAGFNNVKGIKLFIKKLKLWSTINFRDSIASYIRYPLITNEKISSREIFLQEYEKVFSDKIRRTLSTQKLSQLFRNFQGVIIGNGEIIIANVSKTGQDEYRIIDINNEE